MHKKYTVFIYELCPYPLYLLAELIVCKFCEFISQPSYSVIEEWKNRTLRVAGDLEISQRWSFYLINKIKKDQKWIKKIIKEYYSLMHELYNYLKEISHQNLKKKTNAQLWQYLDGFRKKYDAMYLRGWMPNGIEGHSNNFSKYLNQYLKRKLKKLDKEGQTGEYFSILTTTQKRIPRQKEEEDFLNLINQILKNKKLRIAFKKQPIEKLVNLIERKYKKLDWAIAEHLKKYIWLLWKYEGPNWDKFYFVGLIKDFLKKNISPKQRLKQIEKARKEIVQKQKKYLKEIGLNKDKIFSRLFELGREFMYFKEHQKDYLFQCYYFLTKIIVEAASRLNLSPDQFRHLLHQEMKQALLKNKYDPEELNERIKHVLLIMKKGQPIKVLTGEKAKRYAKKTFPSLPRLKIFKGECACAGHVQGKVKIIQEMRDIPKMQPGDILVTTRTNPNLLPAMKKARAIVADIGGIGSHAAIVARELGIPAIVGVDIASVILKDGDKVEVNATEGIVKKLK